MRHSSEVKKNIIPEINTSSGPPGINPTCLSVLGQVSESIPAPMTVLASPLTSAFLECSIQQSGQSKMWSLCDIKAKDYIKANKLLQLQHL